MKIVFISRYPEKGVAEARRGISGYTKHLAEALVEVGADVRVLAERLDGEADSYVENGVAVKRIWRLGHDDLGRIADTVSNLAPTVVHLQNELFALGAGLRSARGFPELVRTLKQRVRAPVVVTMHGVLPAGRLDRLIARAYVPGLPRWMVRQVYRSIVAATMNYADAVIAPSWSLLNSLMSYQRLSQYYVIPHGIPDVSRQSREAGLELFRLPDRRRAVFFGYQLPYKGIETLEASAAYLADAGIEVLIAGGTSQDADGVATSRRRSTPPGHGNVARMGYVHEAEIPYLFAIADTMVLPHRVGLANSGPFSLAVAYRTPVVVSNAPPLAEALDFVDATFPVGDALALADRVVAVTHDAIIRGRLEERLRVIAETRSWPAVARMTMDAYRRLVSR